MNLLLLLSALLSALAGVQGQVRAAAVPVAVSQVAERVSRVAPAQAATSGRPATTFPRADEGQGTRAAWSLAPAAPIYLSRRRE